MNEPEREFHLEEFRQLKGEIVSILLRIDSLARYSIVVAAAVFAWLAVQGVGVGAQGASSPWCLKLPKELYAWALYIPAAFALFSGLAAAVSISRVRQIGSYLLTLETAMGNRALGWERALKREWPIVTALGMLFWIAFVGSTVYAAYRAGQFIKEIPLTCSAEKR